MKIGFLGTGFGRAHAAIYRRHPEVAEVVLFGRTAAKLEKVADEYGFATTTNIDTIYDDPAIDLVDVCVPTPVHADHVVRALEAGKDVLCELPLASTMADAHRIVEAQQASGRHVFVDMFGRFDPSNDFLQGAVSEGTYGTLETLETATRTARLWEGYALRLDSIAMDVMHSSLDTIVMALPPESMIAVGTERERAGSGAAVRLQQLTLAFFARHRASTREFSSRLAVSPQLLQQVAAH
jgi:predicted dehydrogenase